MKKPSFVLAMVIMGLTGISLKAQNGWMISASSGNNSPPPYYIWHTTDGGSHWEVQYTDSTQGSFYAIQFTDLNNGWVVGDSGKILKTTNGGSTWALVTNTGITADYSTIKCLFFLNANTGWIPAAQSSWPQHIVLHTTDGGNSWTRQSVDFNGGIFNINFWDANNGWFSGEQCVQNCSGPDSLTVSAGVIAHTTTGGESGWAFQSNPGHAANLGKVQFVSPTEGWISSDSGHLLHTNDAGTNWTVVTPFPNDTVMSMADPAITMSWANQTHGWKINWFGSGIYDAHGAVIYQTADGGNTWARKVLSTAAGDLGIQVQFVDENNGWATVANLSTGSGSFLRTTDGGNTWNPITMTQRVGGIYYYVDAGAGAKGRLANRPIDNPISIFPNPTHGAFRITFKNAAARPEIEIYNAYGVKVYGASNFKQQTSNEINLSKYSKGIYFVKISDGGNIHTKKIVIQ